MSFVMAVPEVLGTAATDLAGLGSSLNAVNAAAVAQTTGVLPRPGMKCRRPSRRCFPRTARRIRP